MKFRMKQYDLICHNGEYERLLEGLNQIALSFSPTDKDGWQNFVMPDQVKISIKDLRNSKNSDENLEGRVIFAVARTTWKEPEYVKRIVNRLGGTPGGESEYSAEGIIDLYLGENYSQLQERIKREKQLRSILFF